MRIDESFHGLSLSSENETANTTPDHHEHTEEGGLLRSVSAVRKFLLLQALSLKLKFLKSCSKMLTPSRTMDPERVLAKAEAFKRKAHRLSLDLRLKSLAEAKKFLREHSVVLWNDKGDLPNLLDATIGRIANDKERTRGKAAENCAAWRMQVLADPEFLDCRFFCKQPTMLHEDLWPYATVFARLNRSRAEDGPALSREARKIVSHLSKEGPSRADHLRKSLKMLTPQEMRAFQRAKLELQNLLILLEQEEPESCPVLDLWENRMPRNIRTKADSISEKDAALHLLTATVRSCVLSPEKNLPRWFLWCSQDSEDLVDSLLGRKECIRVQQGRAGFLIPRRIL